MIEVKTAPNLVLEELEKMPGVESASHVMSRGDWTVVEIATEPNIDLREALHELMIDRKWPLRELTRRTASLEDAFVGLTKSLDEERAESH